VSQSDHKRSALADTTPQALRGAAFMEAFRQIVREELKASNGNGHASLMTAEQLAKTLQVNKATVYEWVKSKSIPFYQAGRFVRFNLAEVLESQRKNNQDPS
jgi:excisionase family DNA binding protein